MTDVQVIPEIKQILGAMLFAAKAPLTVAEMRRVFREVAEEQGGPAKDFGEVTEKGICEALEQLQRDFEAARLGVHVVEVANGFRLQNDETCGIWLRHLLERGRGNRLTKPALETLAIIAYRQPCSRAEIEAVRGVAVDQIVRNLMDLQIIKIVGRSELPGRPWLFGTTQKFLEYFGLKNVNDLPGVEELRRMEAEQQRKKDQPEQMEAVLEPAPEDVPAKETGESEKEETRMNNRNDGDEEEEVQEEKEEKEEKEEEEEEDDDEDDDEDEEDEEEE
ncbi:MAG: SMC-Scp complex subunit ScpB [bacterium]